MRHRVPAIALVTLLLATALGGCLDDGDARQGLSATADGNPPLLASPPTAAERAARTLDTLPTYTAGETFTFHYWHVRTGIDTTLEVTVAYRDDEGYGFGFPASEQYAGATDALITHVPPLGPVDATTLSWRVHEKVFQPLAFPLTLGKSWETTWQNDADAVTAEVVSIEGTVAQVEMIGSARHIHLTYDAFEGMITRFEVVDYGGFELIDHTYRPPKAVVVPADHAPVILDSRVQTTNGRDGAASPPMADYAIADEYTHAATMYMLGTTLPDLPSRQAVHMRANPHGEGPESYSREYVPGESPQFETFLGFETDPGGLWSFLYDGEGPGTFATIEFIGYVEERIAFE